MKRKAGLLFFISIMNIVNLLSQEQPSTPEIMGSGTIEEQLDYIQQRTNIYNNFRAIREDIFLILKKNTLDSLKTTKSRISELEEQIITLQKEIESGEALLQKTRDDLEHAVKNRNNIPLLGISMNKVLYNTIMWTLVTGLIVLLVIISLIYLRTRSRKTQLSDEISEIQEQFESHRKSTREKIEKMVVDHFNEIRRIKEK